MAKKSNKKGKKRPATRRSRGRVGAFAGGVDIEMLGSVFAGAVASKALNGIGKNIKPLQGNKFAMPLLKLGIGGYLAAKSPNPMLKNMGLGFIAEGGLSLLENAAPNVFQKLTGDINGIGAADTLTLDLEQYVSGPGGAYVFDEDHSVGAFNDVDVV